MDLQQLWSKIKSDRFLFAGFVLTVSLPVIWFLIAGMVTGYYGNIATSETYDSLYFADGSSIRYSDLTSLSFTMSTYFCAFAYVIAITVIACIRSATNPSKHRCNPGSDKSPDHQ